MQPQDRSERPLDRIASLMHCYSDPQASAAYLLCDRHDAAQVAYTLVESDLSSIDLTYGTLRRESECLATALASLGLRAGDRVATLMGKTREYLVTVLAIWRLGAVHVPLFTAFAPAAIALRVTAAGVRLTVCDQAQRPKLDGIVAGVARCKILTTGPAQPGDLRYADALAGGQAGFPAAVQGGDAPIIQIYTSGTTGAPKSVLVPLRAVAAFHAYAEYALGLRADDVLWNAADPGWAYGLYYGIILSLATGVRSILFNGGFSAATTLQLLSQYKITHFTAAPTVYRSLRESGMQPHGKLNLRGASSAGEPLTPEVNDWASKVLGVLVHDHYGQTETGMLINNHHHAALKRPLRRGSMGQALPGWHAAVLKTDSNVEAAPGEFGRVAMDLCRSPLAWFDGYVNDAQKSAEKFSSDGCWYLTGDVGCVDADGYFQFSARDDDVIIMAGYRIGPFEIESVLSSHSAISECAVVAGPDPVRGEVVEAFVVLCADTRPSRQLTDELQAWVKKNYAAHAYPRRIHYVETLPKTPSGKVQRHVLRRQLRTAASGALRGARLLRASAFIIGLRVTLPPRCRQTTLDSCAFAERPTGRSYSRSERLLASLKWRTRDHAQRSFKHHRQRGNHHGKRQAFQRQQTSKWRIQQFCQRSREGKRSWQERRAAVASGRNPPDAPIAFGQPGASGRRG